MLRCAVTGQPVIWMNNCKNLLSKSIIWTNLVHQKFSKGKISTQNLKKEIGKHLEEAVETPEEIEGTPGETSET